MGLEETILYIEIVKWMINMIGNLEYYKVFYYVATSGSITLAAKELSVSQPAVSQSIKQLEDTLGISLFIRSAKGIHLTKEGQLLFSYVESGYEKIEHGVEKLKKMMTMELGEIRIGASDMTLKYFLLPYLEKFHDLYPGIKVMVTNAPTPDTVNILQSGKIEFGVVSTPFERKSNMEVVPVRKIEDVFVAGRRFLPYKNKMLDFHDLENMPIICLEKNTSTRSYVDGVLKAHGVHISPEFELATSDMIVQFALRNLGIGCVVKDFAKEYIDNGLLFELRFNTMLPGREFYVITDTQVPLSLAARNLLDLIKRENRNGDKDD